MTSDVELIVAADAEDAARCAADQLARAVEARDHIALAGGSTPRRAYELAAELERDWSRAEIWFGDERCVPADDERSNFRLVRGSLLDRLARGPRAVHRIEGELGCDDAAARYDAALHGVELGLVLLGIGTDGHTASLFPGSPALRETERLAVAVAAADVDRVTLTLPALRSAATVAFLAVGAEKADAVARALADAPDERTPASLVRGSARTLAILDRAAAQALPRVPT